MMPPEINPCASKGPARGLLRYDGFWSADALGAGAAGFCCDATVLGVLSAEADSCNGQARVGATLAMRSVTAANKRIIL
jgi:hypothetical protein